MSHGGRLNQPDDTHEELTTSPLARRGPAHGWSIRTKLTAIVVVFVAIIAVLIAAIALSFNISTGVRAYVGGEGLWSKGQKDAVYYLTRYARSRDPQDFEKYRQAIAIPLGDGDARQELLKPEYDYAVVERGFIAGGNAREDIPHMVFLFRAFGDVSYMRRAIGIWTLAEADIRKLQHTAEELHAAILAGHEPDALLPLVERIERINARVTPLEQQFSATLGEAARWVRQVLIVAIGLVTVLLLGTGLAVALGLARSITLGIRRLREGAVRVYQGELGHRIQLRSRDELGDLAEVFNAMVEQRGAAEEALRSANEFRDKVMQNATDAIYVLDPAGRFTLVNRRTCEITGYSTSELLGTHYGRLFTAPHRVGVDFQFQHAASGRGTVADYETELRRQDGAAIIISFSIAPLIKDGEVAAVVGTAEDITTRKRTEAVLAARAEELARSNAELEQFAYIASHDLQEPLRTVNSYTQLLARRYMGADDDAREFVGFITDAVHRMRALIDGLLAFSRVTKGEDAMRRIDLDEVLSAVRADLKGAIAESGAKVTSDELPEVRGDPAQLAQLLQNLLGNALKFRGDRQPEVHIGVQHTVEGWLISVRDNGIGIEPQHAERVFTLFSRLHTRDVYPGSGLGLAICRKIVERHGGRIWVEPAPKHGSMFKFTLPALPENTGSPR